MNDSEIIAEIKRIRGLFAQNTPEANKDAFAKFSRLLPLMGNNQRAAAFVKEMTYLYRNRFVNDYVKESSVIVADAQKVGGEILNGLSKVVQRGRSANLTDKEIEAELDRVFSPKNVNWAKTWNRTAQMALNRLGKFDNVEGDPLLKYVGASATQRSFCKLNLGKVKRKSEWEETLNDFGSSALTYGGGYNCRHRLEVVDGQAIEKPSTNREEGLFSLGDGFRTKFYVGGEQIYNAQKEYSLVKGLLNQVKSKSPFFDSLRESAERYRGLSPRQFEALIRELNKQGYDFKRMDKHQQEAESVDKARRASIAQTKKEPIAPIVKPKKESKPLEFTSFEIKEVIKRTNETLYKIEADGNTYWKTVKNDGKSSWAFITKKEAENLDKELKKKLK